MSSVLLFTPIFHYYGVIEISNTELGNITGYQLLETTAEIQRLDIHV